MFTHQRSVGERDTLYVQKGRRWADLPSTPRLPTKLKVGIFIHYEDMKGDTKCPTWVAWTLG